MNPENFTPSISITIKNNDDTDLAEQKTKQELQEAKLRELLEFGEILARAEKTEKIHGFREMGSYLSASEKKAAVKFLIDTISNNTWNIAAKQIREIGRVEWWVLNYHGFGRRVRNLLRRKFKRISSIGLDEIWFELVEEVIKEKNL